MKIYWTNSASIDRTYNTLNEAFENYMSNISAGFRPVLLAYFDVKNDAVKFGLVVRNFRIFTTRKVCGRYYNIDIEYVLPITILQIPIDTYVWLVNSYGYYKTINTLLENS